MKICITPKSVAHLGVYFKKSIPEFLYEGITYDELLNTLYDKALQDFKTDITAARDREVILQHLTIVPQIVTSLLGENLEARSKVSKEFATEMDAIASEIYKASQSPKAETFNNEVLKIANIVGIAPMEIVRLTEEEHFDAVSWHFARTIVQESVWDPVTGYKENLKDPNKVQETNVQNRIIQGYNSNGYRFKLAYYGDVKNQEGIVDTTEYTDDTNVVMLVVDKAGNIVKFNQEGVEDANGKSPLFKIKTARSEFDYQVNALAKSLSITDNISIAQATSIIEERLSAHLQNVNEAISRIKDTDVFFEMDMGTSSAGFYEINERFQTPLSRITNRDQIKFTIEKSGTNQNLPMMHLPFASKPAEVRNGTLDKLDPQQKDFLMQLFTNNNLMLDGKELTQIQRRDFISNYVRLNFKSNQRPVIALSYRNYGKSTELDYITLGNKQYPVPRRNEKPETAQDKIDAFIKAFDQFSGQYKGYHTTYKPKDREIAESLDQVEFQGQYFRDENGKVKVASKPEISFGLFAKVNSMDQERTVITNIAGNNIEIGEQTIKDHVISTGKTMAMPTKSDAGLILRGHGSYIGFKPMESDSGLEGLEEADIKFRSISESNESLEKPTAQEETEADRWYNSHPLSKVLKLSISDQVSERGKSFVASFLKDTITLYAGHSKTDLYHETFHAYFDGILNQEEQEAIYNEVRKLKGTFTTTVNGVSKTLKYSEAENIEIEEFLAEEFRAYARNQSKYNKKPSSKVTQFFKKLLDMIKSFFGKRTPNEIVVLNKMAPIVESAFRDLYTGNIDASKFVAPVNNKEKFTSFEVSEDLGLSYQEMSIIMGSIQALISDYVSTVLNSTSTISNNKKLVTAMVQLSTLDITNPEYEEQSDKIKSQIHQLQAGGVPNGYGIFRLNENPQLLEYALNYVKNHLTQRRDFYAMDKDGVIAKENVELLDKVLENFGPTKVTEDTFEKGDTTIMGVFFNNYSNINTKGLVEFEESVDDSEQDLEQELSERLIFGKTGAEFSPHETADKYTEQLLSSIIKYTGQGEGKMQTNRIGVGRLLPFETAIGKVVRATKGLTTPEQMFKKLVEVAETDNEISQIVRKLGDINNPSITREEQRQWTAFWQSINRSAQRIRTLTMEKVDVAEGEESYYIAKSGRIRQGASIVGREWKSNFSDNIQKKEIYNESGLLDPVKLAHVFGELFPDEANAMSTSELREYARLREMPGHETMNKADLVEALTTKKYIPLEGSGSLYHDTPERGVSYMTRREPFYVANPFPMLRALGIELPETREVRNAIVYGDSERGIEPGIINYIHRSMANRENAVDEQVQLVDDFDALFDSYSYEFWDRTIDNINYDNQLELHGYIKMLQEIGQEMSDDHVTHTGYNAKGDRQSERPFHSSLTLQVSEINSAKSYDELISIPGMEHFDYRINPQVAASPWLVQRFNLNNPSPSIRGTVNEEIKITVETLGGSQVKHNEVEQGISSLASDEKTKYNTDFVNTLLGRQEIMRAEAKATSLAVYAPQKVRGHAVMRKSIVINAEEINSIFSEEYSDIKGNSGLLLYNQFVGHLEAELVRISRLEKLGADLKAGKEINFDPSYIERGKQFYMFDLILSDSLKGRLRDKNISESFTLNTLLSAQEKKEIEMALVEHFRFRANEEQVNHSQDLTIPKDLMKDFERKDDTKEDTVQRLLQAFIVNNFLQNANYAATFLGDPASYNVPGEDYHKRIAGLISTGTLFRYDNSWYTFVNDPRYQIRGLAEKHAQEKGISLPDYEYKGYLSTGVIREAKFDSVYKEHYDSFFKADLNKMTLKGLKSAAESLGIKGYKSMKKDQLIDALNFETSEYTGMKEADGQGWITLDSYRHLAEASRDWTPEQEDIYQKILKGEEIDYMKVAETFPVKKYQYYGPVSNKQASDNVDLSLTAFHKYSLLPLIPGVIEGTPLEDLNNRMMEEGLDYVTMESGSKLSTIMPIAENVEDSQADDIYNKEREVTNNTFTKNVIHVRHLKNQVSVNSKFKGKISLWTQMRSMVVLGLASNGVPMDYTGKKSWDSLTDQEKLDNSDNWKMLNEMKKITDEMRDLLKEDLLSDIGLNPVLHKVKQGDKTITKVTYTGDTRRLAKYLQDQMKSEDMLPEEVAYIVKEDGQLIDDLSLSVNSEKIEKMLIAMVDKRLRRLKVNGEGLTQVAGTMWEKKGAKPELATYENWGSNGLRTYYYENGEIRKMEVKIALQGNFKKLLKLNFKGEPISVYKEGKLDSKASLARLNEAIKDEAWLEEYGEMITIAGPRIPSQQENSLESARIAEFLPPIAGPIIVLPSEVVAKAGSDFDHDKLFMMFQNIAVYGKGKNAEVKRFEYNRSLKNVSREELSNDLATAKENIKNLRDKRKTALDKRDVLWDEIKDVRDQIKAELSEEDVKTLDDLSTRWASVNGHINALLKEISFKTSDGAHYRYADISREERLALIDKFLDEMDEIDEAQDQIRNSYYDRVNELVKSSKEIKPSTKANLTKINNQIDKLNADLEVAYKNEVDAQKRLDGKSIKGLENELLELFAKRITSGDNMKALVQNNSTDQVQPVSEQLESFVRGKYNKYNRGTQGEALSKEEGGISGTTIYDYRYNLLKHQENSVGMDSLGIAAVLSTFHAMFTQMGANLQGVTQEQQDRFNKAIDVLNEPEKYDKVILDDASKIVDEYSAYTIKLPHNNVDTSLGKSISLGFRENVNGKTISSVIGQLINGYVDVAKDAWIFNAQGNKENTPVLLFLVMAGVSPKTAIYFTSSPIVRKYTKYKEEMGGVYSNLNTEYDVSPLVNPGNIKSSARAKVFEEFSEMILKNEGRFIEHKDAKIISNGHRVKNYTDEELLKSIKQNKETWDDFVLFTHYLELEDMASDLTRFTSNTKFATQKISSVSDAQGRMDRTNLAKKMETSIPDQLYSDMESKTMNGSFSNDEFYVQLFSEYFKLRNHPTLVRASVSVKNPEGTEKTVVQNDLKNDFIAYLAQNSLHSLDTYDGITIEKSDNPKDLLDYVEDEDLYIYGEEEAQYQMKALQGLLLNTGNTNHDLINKFPTLSHFIRYDIEYKRLQLETENMTDEEFQDKYYYVYDTFGAVNTRSAALAKLALYRSDNNIAMFDARMGMASIFMEIKKKHPQLEQQFDLVYGLSRDFDKSLGKMNLFLRTSPTPDMLRIYKENYNDLINSSIPEVAEFFSRFAIMSLMQTGMNRRAKYDLVRIVNNDIFEVIINNGGHLADVFRSLDQSDNQYRIGTKDIKTKYLDEFVAMFTDVLNNNYRTRSKGVNYITDNFAPKIPGKSNEVKPEPLNVSQKNAESSGKVVRIAMGEQNRKDIQAGVKTTTLRSQSQIDKIGLQKGESAMMNVMGSNYVVTYRGMLSVEEAGGIGKVIKSEGLSTTKSEENPYPVQYDGKTYYAKYKQTVNFLLGQGGLGVYDIRKPLLGEKSQETSKKMMNIYAGTNENAHLSNFANRPFTVYSKSEGNNHTFNTVEGAFQAAKLGFTNSYLENGKLDANQKDILERLKVATGAEAKRIGRTIQDLNVESWDENASAIMKRMLIRSFEQNPQALKSLMATGNATLTHTQDKGKWGAEFPKLLMEVRDELSSVANSNITQEDVDNFENPCKKSGE